MDFSFRLLAKNSGEEVPLKVVAFDCTISDFLAQVKIAQKFMNESEIDALETEFKYPVEEPAAITALVIRLEDGSEIEARVMDKEKATERYQDSLASGHTSYMAY
jgi:hypothetical protein